MCPFAALDFFINQDAVTFLLLISQLSLYIRCIKASPLGLSSVLDNCIRECGCPGFFTHFYETVYVGTLDVISRQKNAENEIIEDRMKKTPKLKLV